MTAWLEVYVFSWRNMKQAKTVMHKGQAPQTKAVKLGGESLSRNISKGIYLTLEVTSSVRQWQQCIVHSLGHTWIFSGDTQSDILQYWYGFCEQFPSRVASSISSFRVRKIKSAPSINKKVKSNLGYTVRLCLKTDKHVNACIYTWSHIHIYVHVCMHS